MIHRTTHRDGTAEVTITVPMPGGSEYRLTFSDQGKVAALALIGEQLAYDEMKVAFHEERVAGHKAAAREVERAWDDGT